MKNRLFLLTVALGWLSIPTMAQTAQQTDPSAALEVKSNTKGFLPPRLTTEQRDAIPNPAMGLLVFNTSTKRLEHYNGTLWGGVAIQTNTVTNTDISFIAVKTSNQTPANGTKITWQNQYNQGGGFDDLTDAFIAPLGGTYFFFVNAISTSLGNIELNFYLNGSNTEYEFFDSNSNASNEMTYGSAILFLNAGDTVDIRSYSTASSEIYGTLTNYSSRFGGFLLSQDE